MNIFVLIMSVTPAASKLQSNLDRLLYVGTAATTKFAEKEQEINTLKARNALLENKAVDNTREKEELEEQSDQLRAEIQQLTQQAESLRTQLELEKGNNDVLRLQLSQITAAKEQAEELIAAYNVLIDEANEKINGILDQLMQITSEEHQQTVPGQTTITSYFPPNT